MASSPPAEQRFLRAVVALALIAHVAAACSSLGYHHFDEHFQVLEVLGEKLGRTPAQALPPEIALRMRPFVEIAPLYAVARAWEALFGISPIALEQLFRLATSLGGLGVCATLARRLSGEVEDRFARRAGVLAFLLFWPLVYTHARLSAECVGSTVFWAGWLLATRAPTPRARIGAGILFGLAFMVRPQLAFALAGFAVWLLFQRDSDDGSSAPEPRPWAPLRALVALAAGFAIGVLAGVLCDRWGYGVFTFTPWSYVRENLFHGMAASFGVEPWWWYLPEAAMTLGGPFGAALLVAVGWFWARRAAHPAALPTLFFVAGHALIGHKELRFLIPALPVIPFALAHALDACSRLRSRHDGGRPPIPPGPAGPDGGRPPIPPGPAGLGLRLLRGAALVYAALSALALPAMVLRPANLPLYYYAYVDAHFGKGYDVWYDGREPMTLGPFEVHFYRPERYRARHASVPELEALLAARPAAPFLFFHDALTLPESPALHARCRLLVETVPWWMHHPQIVAGLDRAILWSLYECGGREPLPAGH